MAKIKIKITYPDGTKKEYDKGTSALDMVKKDIGEGLARASIAAKIDEDFIDMTAPINKSGNLTIFTFKDPEGQEVFRHSSAHLMAQAVNRIYKKIKQGVGPAIEDGFYQDFDIGTTIKMEDLPKIEQEMKNIVKENIAFERKEMSKKDALKLFKGDPYKTQMIEELEGAKVTVYTSGEYKDLCRGPHVPSTGYIKSFKLTQVSGAYWKGDANNKMLQRIYGVSFPDKKELKKHLAMLEEALKRDHMKLGKDLDIFVTSPLVGQGLPLFTPKGTKIIKKLQRFVEDEEERRGYSQTMTPFMAKSDLYKVSGHWDHYKEGMFIVDGSGEQMALRPMTCPFQFQIYKSRTRSYRDLPIRYSETSPLFRNEDSGEMHGLMRLRQFTISEGHLVCRMDQLEEEFRGVIDLIDYIFKTLGFKDYWYRFSKWDPNDKGDKYIDNPKAWKESEAILKKIIDGLKLEYTEAIGEAAFYGPKLDIQMKNVYGKEDTIITVQIDFALPERFGLTYEGEDGKKHQPIVIHRTSIGCYERTLALLIEHYAGKFPLWLNPNQVRILTIADRHNKYAEKVKKNFSDLGISAEVDDRSLTMNKKIREAEIEHYNYILVIGDNEIKNKTVNVRTRENKVLGEQKMDEFLVKLTKEIEDKK